MLDSANSPNRYMNCLKTYLQQKKPLLLKEFLKVFMNSMSGTMNKD